MQFVDQCNILIKAGNGGNGIIAWRREAHYPEGGPAGGDGGDGGNVVIIGDSNLSTLFHLRYLKKVEAENGQNGMTKMCFGKKGNDTYIKVPLGTQIYDAKTKKIIIDILFNKQKYIIAYGGKGGHGNAFFKSSLNKAPTLYENGDLGQEILVEMKLKYLADVGLIGLPNAGKSTIISCLSNAKPKIANYQFTTLSPVLGTIKDKNNQSIVIADIPGIIEGAWQNKGLGLEFLKHIERCHLLLHVISLDKNDHLDIVKAYQIVNDELKKYDSSLIQKKQIIICNKNDVVDANNQKDKLLKIIGNCDFLSISALKNKNILVLKDKILEIVNTKKNNPIDKSIICQDGVDFIQLTQNQSENIDKKFNFFKNQDNKWIIQSEYLSYWLKKIPLTTKDNIYRFKQKMDNCKVDEILKKNGAKSKDSFFLDEVEFEID